ncbi:MAG: carboxypeptidase-like regulatory domain-containing protein, partial [Bacteroidales bacterium]|nr:carboxypeptidase-like regulatory domain-containing protein [Bacteroidales bacterium]
MKRNWIKKLIGGISFTSALFVFQACYGTGHDRYYDYYIEGTVRSKTTGEPLPDIKISLAYSQQYANTNMDGQFSFYLEKQELYKFRFEDTDSLRYGNHS